MKNLMIAFLFLSSCALDDAVPDTLRVGAFKHVNDGDLQTTTGVGATSDTDGYSVGATLGWNFGAQQPRADHDFDMIETAMANALSIYASKVHELDDATHVGLVIDPATNLPIDDTHAHPDQSTDVLSILRWYTETDLVVKIIVAILLLSLIVTIIIYRKPVGSVVASAIAYVTPDRFKKKDEQEEKCDDDKPG